MIKVDRQYLICDTYNDPLQYPTSFALANSTPTANIRYPTNKAMAMLRWTKLCTVENNFLLHIREKIYTTKLLLNCA